MDIMQGHIPRRGQFNLDTKVLLSFVWITLLELMLEARYIQQPWVSFILYTEHIRNCLAESTLFFASSWRSTCPYLETSSGSQQTISEGLLVQQQAPVSLPGFYVYARKSLPHSDLLFGFSQLGSCHLMFRISS